MKIKVFDKNLCCESIHLKKGLHRKNIPFEIGKEYKFETTDVRELVMNTLFHYCNSLQEAYTYCREIDDRFCEIEILNEKIEDFDDDIGANVEIYVSNHFKIIREITGEELNNLKGLFNGNTGVFNTGGWNSGNCNTGDHNSGNLNTGMFNRGFRNSGKHNTGNHNTGNYNHGNYNTGDYNANHHNTGNHNAGPYNTGNHNTGYHNSGNYNRGDYNSGNRNTGRYNTGDCNSGHHNTGGWNSCCYSNGFFNTKEPTVNIFNIDSGMTAREFRYSIYYEALTYAEFMLTKKIPFRESLKYYSYQEACADWWERTPEKYRKIITEIPNFDKEIFKEITGIEI